MAQLQQTLAEHGSLAKSERDLQYAAGWHQRRIAELQKLVAEHKANLEQTEEITTEQEKLAEIQADLAQVSAERQLALQSAAAQVVTGAPRWSRRSRSSQTPRRAGMSSTWPRRNWRSKRRR